MVHTMEQQWPTANIVLDEQLDMFRRNISQLEQEIGLTGDSLAFAYMRAFITQSRMENGMGAVVSTEIMCAAAFTRLTRVSPRATDDMTGFEESLKKKGTQENGK
jgi:hypothetical protein